MRENSNVTDGLNPEIMGKSGIVGQTDDFPRHSIKCIVDLAMTKLTLEGMGNSTNRVQNGKHMMNGMKRWMEYYETDSMDAEVTHRGCSK